MPDPATYEPPSPLDPNFGLMFLAAGHLAPLFQTNTIDLPLARRMALRAIEAYRPETRADYVNVARTIAFSMTALALLGNTASADMTPPEKMRAFGRANALNRSADQSERTMMQRRRHQQARARSSPAASSLEHESPFEIKENDNLKLSHPDQPAPGPESDAAELKAAIGEVMKEYRAARVAAGFPPTASETTPRQPPPSAIRYDDPRSRIAQPQPMSHKSALLRNTAMPRNPDQGVASGQSLTPR